MSTITRHLTVWPRFAPDGGSSSMRSVARCSNVSARTGTAMPDKMTNQISNGRAIRIAGLRVERRRAEGLALLAPPRDLLLRRGQLFLVLRIDRHGGGAADRQRGLDFHRLRREAALGASEDLHRHLDLNLARLRVGADDNGPLPRSAALDHRDLGAFLGLFNRPRLLELADEDDAVLARELDAVGVRVGVRVRLLRRIGVPAVGDL